MHAQLFGKPDVSQVKTLISMKKVITAVLCNRKVPLTSCTLTSFDFHAYRHRAWPASSPMHPPASIFSCAYSLFIHLSFHTQQAEQAASAWIVGTSEHTTALPLYEGPKPLMLQ